MKMPFLLISPKIVPKIQLIKKGGCFEYHAVIADKIEYRYIHRASICPASGMDRRSFFMPKTMGKYKRLEVFHLSKPVYTADKPSDCHYCYFWTNGRKGCRLGRNNCYYLISLPPKPKSECDGCPYGRDHPCIGWCTKKVMREVGLRWYGCVWTGIPLLLFCPIDSRRFCEIAVVNGILQCYNFNVKLVDIQTLCNKVQQNANYVVFSAFYVLFFVNMRCSSVLWLVDSVK